MDVEANEELSLRETIENAVKEVKEPTVAKDAIVDEKPEAQAEEKPTKERDETGKFKAKETTEATAPEVKKPKIEAPTSWSAGVKSKWDTLDHDLQGEISKREAEMHRMMTAPDGELNLGRKMKEVISPYMAIIQSEGGEPVGAVRDLLNTAYVLRTADPVRKAQLIQQVIQQYGVDMSLLGQQNAEPQDELSALKQELAQLRQMANPEVLTKQLQAKMENDRVVSEIEQFSRDPANVHYAKVVDYMMGIAPTIRAQNPAASPKEILQMSYDAACYADKEIRSTLEAQKINAELAKKSQEILAKKKASVSVTGSPGVTVPNSGAPDRSLADELRHNYRALTSS